MPRFQPDKDYYRLQRLSWSGFRKYRECPHGYKLRYVDDLTVTRNAYHAIGGKVIQKVFENFYNNEVWRQGGKVGETLAQMLPREFKSVCREEIVLWNAPESRMTPKELYESLKPLIPSTLRAIKEHKLLGRYARSEVKVQAWIDKVLVHGTVDFIIRRENEHIILDGKLTRHRKKYLKVDQLIWYVMLFYLQHRSLVQKTGWIYYTYGEVEWVPVTMTDIKRLHAEAKEAIRLIKKNKFDPNPTPDNCQWCDYKKKCPASDGMELQGKANRDVKRKKQYQDTGSPLARDVDGEEEIGF